MKRSLAVLISLAVLPFLPSASLTPITPAILRAQPAALSGQSCTPTGPLISWWDGDTISGDTAVDVAGSGNDGVLQNGVTFDPGVRGQAFRFDGVDDVIEFGTTISYSAASGGAVAAWVKATPGTDDWSTIFEHDRDGIGNYAVQLRANNASLAAEFSLFNGNYYTAYGSVPVLDGQWHFVVGQWNTAGLAVYVDGVLDGNFADTIDLGVYTPGGSRAGMIYWNGLRGHYFGGLIDELQIFDRPLTAEEIGAAYDACGQAETIADLAQQVRALGLPGGLENALLSKLDAAQRSVDRGSLGAAANQLRAFVNQVAAKRDKAIDSADADALIESALSLIASLKAA